MKVISGKNSSGKTKELIKYSLDAGIPIFALTLSKKNSLIDKSIAYFNRVVKVILPNDLSNGEFDSILIDDIETVCMKLIESCLFYSDFTIAGATITED